jgi:hypothetical protein
VRCPEKDGPDLHAYAVYRNGNKKATLVHVEPYQTPTIGMRAAVTRVVADPPDEEAPRRETKQRAEAKA